MTNMPIQATAEGVPTFTLSPARSFRRFLNRCRAAIAAFRHCGEGHAFSVIYERTGMPGDDDGNPSHCGDIPRIDWALDRKKGTKTFMAEVGCHCHNPRIVMVLGDLVDWGVQ